jgi:S1-C subfamily serine protease
MSDTNSLQALSDALLARLNAPHGPSSRFTPVPTSFERVHWRDGLIVTTDGTVRRTEGITVTLPDGRSVAATLQGRDPGTDLALLRIETGLLPVAERATSSLKPGHLVLAIGRLDENGPRTSFGAVSSVGPAWRSWKGGEIDAQLQSDLTIYPGWVVGRWWTSPDKSTASTPVD